MAVTFLELGDGRFLNAAFVQTIQAHEQLGTVLINSEPSGVALRFHSDVVKSDAGRAQQVVLDLLKELGKFPVAPDTRIVTLINGAVTSVFLK